MGDDSERVTWVLVDGENIDATLGGAILGRRPHSDERPRWDRVLGFAEEKWGAKASGLFFLNANGGVPTPFVQALRSMSYRVIALSGSPEDQIVDVAILRMLTVLAERDANVLLVSHDGDFLARVGALVNGERRIGVLAFSEFRSARYASIAGVELYDLEYDAKVFDSELPRLRITPIEEFDPTIYLV